MQTKVIDLIIHLVRMLRVGDNIRELNPDILNKYNKSEVSAAYSWVLQKMEDGQLSVAKHSGHQDTRVLHLAERMAISTEAQGYLIELYSMGILNYHQMEAIIEQSMMNNFEIVTLDKMKEMVRQTVFGSNSKGNAGSIYLRGNESVN
jgi:uncharacterized protein Smg (DUF494 family)